MDGLNTSSKQNQTKNHTVLSDIYTEYINGDRQYLNTCCLPEQLSTPSAGLLGHICVVCRGSAAPCLHAGSLPSACLYSSELLVNAQKSDAAPVLEWRSGGG